MKKRFFTLMLLLVGSVAAFAQSMNNDDEVVKIDPMNRLNSVEGEVIVKFADDTPFELMYDRTGNFKGTGLSSVDKLLRNYELVAIDRLCPNDDPKRELRSSKSYNGGDVVERDLSRLCLVKINTPADKADNPEYDIRVLTDRLIEEFNAMDEVEFAEPNYFIYSVGIEESPSHRVAEMVPSTSSDTALVTEPVEVTSDDRDGGHHHHNHDAYHKEPFYKHQWGLKATKIDKIWEVDENEEGDRMIIAVLDTGVDIEHADLADNIWTNPNEIDNNSDDDGNGYKDDIHGYDFVNKTAKMDDYNGHGTHCAGIIAAVGDNGIGVVGANPKTYIMPITVMQSNGTGSISTIIEGISYAKNNGADIISMSIGTYAYSIALEQALAQAYQSSVLVAAAGNDGLNIDETALCANPYIVDMPMYPAAFTFVLGVQATTETEDGGYELASFSNYDCDGPSYSGYSEEQLYNYELRAPGTDIVSTVQNGNYKYLNGTSMACPLVAGGISALLHAKPYASQEMLWGDLINTSGANVDFEACYNAGPAPAQLQLVTYELNDEEEGDGDLRPDAGETMLFYPTIRTTWGAAEDITYWIEFDENEDNTTIEFIDNENIDFGHNLSAYAKSKAVNPVKFKINENVVDGRYICLVLKATCPNAEEELSYPFTIKVENGVELKGILSENTTLEPNVHYIVTETLGVPEGVTLTIMPGTTIRFKDGVKLVNKGKIIAKGTKDNMITFTKTDLGVGTYTMQLNRSDTLSYCIIEYATINNDYSAEYHYCYSQGDEVFEYISDVLDNTQINNVDVNYVRRATIDNSIVRYSSSNSMPNYTNSNLLYNYNLYVGRMSYSGTYNDANVSFYNGVGGIYEAGNNIIGNYNDSYYKGYMFGNGKLSYILLGNLFSNYQKNGDHIVSYYDVANEYTDLITCPLNGTYLGSSNDEIISSRIYDIDTPNSTSLNDIDESTAERRPSSKAHGIVWKVLVNGKDAQDEFDEVVPLGVGEHKFEVYFNRAMDKSVTPMVAMGVRPPYTQVAIAENGSWSADSTIYTVYLNLNASTVTDGLNRIYVANARDNENFEIPVENMRFNVQVSAAGSMSTGFEATPGIGKVDLAWENDSTYFNDHLGWNMYRYQKDERGVNTDTILINTEMITEETKFTDYDVISGERYYYYYKTLRTNLTESDASTNVSTVPLTAQPGDANGSLAVDVADIVTIVSYITGTNPQPFVFGAADVNEDGEIDVMDIVSIVSIITTGKYDPDRLPSATATYSIEDGILYVDTPVELAGVQVFLDCDSDEYIEALSAMDDFEQVGMFVEDGRYLFLAYSMSGAKLSAGKHDILKVGYADVDEMTLSDVSGTNVLAVEETLGVEGSNNYYVMNQPYPNPFNGSLTIPYLVGDDRGDVTFTITNVMGQQVVKVTLGTQSRGEYSYEWQPKSDMPTGIYLINMYVNGNMIQRSKVVYMK
ncbi:MAG: S8 family serine peptidase [Bacteroidales bacterium]|nr:S8 family serine peptidase [Bacteroidales bacterium]